MMRAAHWALPFVVVLAVSSMLAYALDGALLAGAAAADSDATPTPVSSGCVEEDTVWIYAGLDSRIPVTRRTSCTNDGPLASGQ